MSGTATPWVLCVDDEPKVLSSLTLSLGGDFDVRTTTAGADALELLDAEPGCAVLVSDMRMPGMDGAELLRRAREAHPDIPRILLTGFAEIDAAIAAINDGQVFRFLLKPCPTDELVAVVSEAMELYRLRNAERELLENTVNGIVVALAQVLAIALPHASFAEAKRKAIREMRSDLGLGVSWELEAAAVLSRLGWLTLTPAVLEKAMGFDRLTNSETGQVDRSIELTVGVLRSIPRFERVAELVRSTMSICGIPKGTTDEAQLSAVLLLERMALAAAPAADIRAALERLYDVAIVDALMAHHVDVSQGELRRCPVKELVPGWVVNHDIVNANGQLVLRQGTMLTDVFIERLRNYAAIGAVDSPIEVWIGG